ncbi:MAG: glycoside hydrolase family 3 protein, partial [Megasphaera micronuciformis]|nr:glycoside hydrolase family 3 protein [Megasphaera micronuciformis]
MTILKRVLLGFLVLAGLFMTGCGPDTIRGKEYPINDEKTVADDADLSIDERVQKIVDAMSDEEKVGQMMMIGIQGTAVTDDTRYMLNQYKAGNIILFDRNMQSQEQVKELTTDLQKENSAKVPLFI